MVRLEVPGHVLQHFWDLANVEAETRQTSAVRLVHELKSAQDAFSVSGAVSDAEMGDAADVGGRLAGDGSGDENEAPPSLTGCSPVLVYALRRLARGLGSGRSGARQGFALALTAAFSEIPLVSLPDGLKLLKTSLDPITQATKGSEARDILMGQLFGVAALVRAMAPRLAAGEMGRKEAVDFAAAVAEEVSALAAAKAYLAESASAVILEIADALGGAEAAGAGGDVTAVLERATSLADWIAAPAADATPESSRSPRSCGRRSRRRCARAATCCLLSRRKRRRPRRPSKKKKERGEGRRREASLRKAPKRGASRRRRGGVRFSARRTWRRCATRSPRPRARTRRRTRCGCC